MKNNTKTRNISPLSWETRLHLAYATSLLNPWEFPRGWVKSRESFPGMTPTNILLTLCYWQTKPFTQTYGSYIMSNFNNFEQINHIIKLSKHQSNHGWKIETKHAPKSTKWTNICSWGFNFSKDVHLKNYRNAMW